MPLSWDAERVPGASLGFCTNSLDILVLIDTVGFPVVFFGVRKARPTLVVFARPPPPDETREGGTTDPCRGRDGKAWRPGFLPGLSSPVVEPYLSWFLNLLQVLLYHLFLTHWFSNWNVYVSLRHLSLFVCRHISSDDLSLFAWLFLV